MTPEQRATILSAVTDWDRKQSTKPGYNMYALSHYCKALQRVALYAEKGYDLRSAVITCFKDRLCDHILKALKLDKMTIEEAKWGLDVKLPYLEVPEETEE
jgi:hypothetical protein